MIISGHVITVGCDSGEVHPYAYGSASFSGDNEKECVASARKEGWIIDLKKGKAICPLCVDKIDERYED